MQVGTYVDGRELTFDQSTVQFAVGGTPVTVEQVREYDSFGQIAWLNEEIHAWFRELPVGIGQGTPPAAVKKGRLLGFRSRRGWKMAVASIYYALWFLLAISVITTVKPYATSARDIAIEVATTVLVLLLFISPALLLSEFSYRDKVPLFNRRKVLWNVAGFAVCFLFVVVAVGLATEMHSEPYKAAAEAERVADQKKLEAENAAYEQQQKDMENAALQKQGEERVAEEKRRAEAAEQAEAERRADAAKQAETAATEKETAPAPSVEAAAKPTSQIGKVVRVGEADVVVQKVERKDQIKSLFGDLSKGHFYVVTLSVKNVSKEPFTTHSTNFALISTDGSEYGTWDQMYTAVPSEQMLFLDSINPGVTKTGVLIFDVSEDMTAASVQVQGGLFDEPVDIRVK